jgi:glycine/D-amino acid oxidase-like deaminating enzyme/nitrite reductase/ring-hydroxylating ferredoxin subunit
VTALPKGAGPEIGAVPDSLWMADTDWPRLDALQSDLSVEALVIGSGITGLTTARLLAEHGLDVAVIDSGRLCSGVTGFTTAKLTALQSTIYTDLIDVWDEDVAAGYAMANLAAIERVRQLVEEDGIECDLETRSAYTYAESDEHLGLIEAEIDAAHRAGLDVSFTTDTDLPFQVAGAVRLDDQAQFHPRRYCRGLVDALLNRGCLMFESTRAIDMNGKQGLVTTDGGTIQADFVFVATHIPFVDTGGYFARMTASRSYAIALGQGQQRVEGMYISVDSPLRSIRSTADGHLIVGGESRPVGEDPDTRDRYQALESWSTERFPGGAIDYRWSAHDYRSVDALPFIGKLGGSDRVFTSTGYAKWGLTNGTIGAEIMVDLALGRGNRFAHLFDSSRLAVGKELLGVIGTSATAVKHLVVNRLSHTEPLELDELMPGSGSVVLVEGEHVGAFRTEDGFLHLVSATCSHLGCRLSLNTAERTWDCPCHGSRFDIDGTVIHGPAVEDLERKER